MTKHVLVSCIHLQRKLDSFRPEFDERGFTVESPEVAQQLEEDWLLANIGRFHGVIAGDDPFTAEVLAEGARGNLHTIIKWGIGVDGIDLEAADHLGIQVTNTPGMFSDEVADVAMGYVVMLARQLHRIHLSVREGGWFKPVGSSLRGKTLGVVGLGSIGRALADRARAFGMVVIGTDVAPVGIAGTWLRQVPLDHLLAASDYVVLCCNLTPDNRYLLRADTLALMKEGAYVVNVARGPLIEEESLINALASGRLAGVALDVFETEPLPSSSQLRRFEQCVWGSHNGSNTSEAVARVNRIAVDELFRRLSP